MKKTKANWNFNANNIKIVEDETIEEFTARPTP